MQISNSLHNLPQREGHFIYWRRAQMTTLMLSVLHEFMLAIIINYRRVYKDTFQHHLSCWMSNCSYFGPWCYNAVFWAYHNILMFWSDWTWHESNLCVMKLPKLFKLKFWSAFLIAKITLKQRCRWSCQCTETMSSIVKNAAWDDILIKLKKPTDHSTYMIVQQSLAVARWDSECIV